MAPRRRLPDPNNPPPITEQDLINQAIGPRASEPKTLDPAFYPDQSYFPPPPAHTPDFRAKPEPGTPDSIMGDAPLQDILHALSSMGSSAATVGQHTLEGGGMAIADAISGLHDVALAHNPFYAQLMGPHSHAAAVNEDFSQLRRDTNAAHGANAEAATAQALDFLFGQNRDTHASPAALEAQHTAGVRNAQDALAAKINSVGDYSNLRIPGMPGLGPDASPEQIQAALFPAHHSDYGEGNTRFTGVQARQQKLAKEALGGIPDVRHAARDPGGVLTTPFDVANAQIDAEAQGKPPPSPSVVSALLNHHIQLDGGPTKAEVRQNAHPAVAALGPVEHVGSIPLAALNDPGMESDLTTPLDAGGPSLPSGTQVKTRLQTDPGGLLRSIQQALSAQRTDPVAPLPTPDTGMESDRTAPPAIAPEPAKKMLPPVKPSGSTPGGDMFPQPAASMMRGADGKISGMRMGGKLISFERDSQGKIANIHIFEGAQ